ncbi:hypothetical protein ACRJ4W_19220 [Streptomyces sp. GLT-R25]
MTVHANNAPAIAQAGKTPTATRAPARKRRRPGPAEAGPGRQV